MGTKPTQFSFAARSWQLANDIMTGKKSGVVQRISGAILDQGLFAGSNFILNILLARWMLEADYGAFAVAYAWFLIPQNVYEAALTEPLTIFGAHKFRPLLNKYLAFNYYQHILMSILTMIVLGGIALATIIFEPTNSLAAWAIGGAAIASPFMLTRWLTRPAFYIEGRPQGAALGSFIYFALSLVMIGFLELGGALTPGLALVTMGLAGATASAILTLFFMRPNFNIRDGELDVQDAINEHVNYARWSTPSRLLAWIPPNFAYVLLPAVLSLQGSAALKVLTNLVQPVYMSMVAITAVMVPSFVRIYHTQGRKGLNQRLKQVIPLSLVFTGGYCVALVALGLPVMNLIFEGQYNDTISIANLLTLGLGQVVLGCLLLMDAALRASGGVKKSFFSKVPPAVFMLTIGSLLIFGMEDHVLGANVATLLTVIISLIGSLYVYFRGNKEPVPPETLDTEESEVVEEEITKLRLKTQEIAID